MAIVVQLRQSIARSMCAGAARPQSSRACCLAVIHIQSAAMSPACAAWAPHVCVHCHHHICAKPLKITPQRHTDCPHCLSLPIPCAPTLCPTNNRPPIASSGCVDTALLADSFTRSSARGNKSQGKGNNVDHSPTAKSTTHDEQPGHACHQGIWCTCYAHIPLHQYPSRFK